MKTLQTFAAVAIAAALTGACTDRTGEAAAPPTEAAATPAMAAAAPAGEAAGAEAFVRSVYAAYSDAPGSTGPDNMAIAYSAELNRLISTGGPNGEGDQRGLDVDPICDCQDWQALTLTEVAVTPSGADRAEARVRFTNGGSPTAQTLLLVREAAGWRVDDVRSADRPSLAAQLREAAASPAT